MNSGEEARRLADVLRRDADERAALLERLALTARRDARYAAGWRPGAPGADTAAGAR